MEYITIRGARVNNLKNISLRLPRERLIVVTGLSGSGKSSLAFDTLYAEGQRRYVESLSAYARQFLGRMEKPDVDAIEGLPPAIAIEQKTSTRNPRSTVGTSTEIYDYLRMLFARVGRTFSPVSGEEVRRHTPEDVVAAARRLGDGVRFLVLAPVLKPADRTWEDEIAVLRQQGYSRIEVGGSVMRLDEAEAASLDGQEVHLVIDRLATTGGEDFARRLTESVETAFREGGGTCALRQMPSGEIQTFSTRFEKDGITFQEPCDAMFSFNSGIGACPTCEGFGRVMGIDEDLVVPDTGKSVHDGCIACWRGEKMGQWLTIFERQVAGTDFPLFTPYYLLTPAQKSRIWHGTKATPDESWAAEEATVDNFFRMVSQNLYKIQYRVMLARYRGKTVCPTCHGARLRKESLYVRVGGETLPALVSRTVGELVPWFKNLTLDAHDAQVAGRLLDEVRTRLQFLSDVGLDYLTLDRLTATLSGGESQRIRLATQLGSSLVGSLYILDEPSVGLHPRDTERLIRVLRRLRDLGNTVLVVEHDEDIIRAADYLVDIGPEAGRLGGQVVFAGTILHSSFLILHSSFPASHTLAYLAGTDRMPVPASRRAWNQSLWIRGARGNNLKNLDVQIPLGVLVCVTGPSGSGKSTLVRDILYRALKRHFDEAAERPAAFTSLGGDLDAIQGVVLVDQSPIGRSTRSNPVTYVRAYDEIRHLLAAQPLAEQLGLTAAAFSFNTDGGRCDECKGEGVVKIPMQFMADLVLPCEACHGKRFKREVLDVKFEGLNVYDILEMTVDQAMEFFARHGQQRLVARLRPLQAVGLGYVKLGQPSSTLSGGENQRVRLALHLAEERVGRTLFLFDEPTMGLHPHDVRRLLSALAALIERGHSVVVVEHNVYVMGQADWVIDLGPSGGAGGGEICAQGTPEQILASSASPTAPFMLQ